MLYVNMLKVIKNHAKNLHTKRNECGIIYIFYFYRFKAVSHNDAVQSRVTVLCGAAFEQGGAFYENV